MWQVKKDTDDDEEGACSWVAVMWPFTFKGRSFLHWHIDMWCGSLCIHGGYLCFQDKTTAGNQVEIVFNEAYF